MNITYLAAKNPHKRDENTTLDEETHIYNIQGNTTYISMTTFIHTLVEPFDEEKIITNMMASQNWEKNKYYGLSREEIKALWEKNRIEASTAGTKMHFNIECFYNNPNLQEQEDSIMSTKLDTLAIEEQYFMNFYNDFKDLLEPFRTEWIVYNEDIKLAGSIDMVFKNVKTGQLEIYDWKRCKEIKKNSGFNKWLKSPIVEHLPDTNFWHYALQLNGYKYILTHKYGQTVGDCYLVCLHPNNPNNNYIRLKVPDLQEEIGELFNAL